MASYIDSKPVFAARAAEFGIPEEAIQNLQDRGWGTLAGLAFATVFAPSQAQEHDYFKDNVLIPVLGDENSQHASSLRRLWWEAQVKYTAEMKRQVDADDKPRKLAPEERKQRLLSLRKRLTGILVEGEFEPAHSVVDRYAHMFEEGNLKIIPWEQHVSRSQELRGETKDISVKSWKADANGLLRESSSSDPPSSALSSDMAMQQALVRRGLAMDMADLMDFAQHQKLVHHYLRMILKEPVVGYARTSWQQVRQADEVLLRKLADATEGALKKDSAGERPLDKLLEQTMIDHEVMLHLLPLPKQIQRMDQVQTKPQFSGSSASSSKRKAQSPPIARQSKKGKGRGKDRGLPLPAALRNAGGSLSRTPEGQRICYGYNLGTCSDSSCQKGVHACCICGKMGHSLKEHSQK